MKEKNDSYVHAVCFSFYIRQSIHIQNRAMFEYIGNYCSNLPEGISSSLRDFSVLVFNIEVFNIKFFFFCKIKSLKKSIVYVILQEGKGAHKVPSPAK